MANPRNCSETAAIAHNVASLNRTYSVCNGIVYYCMHIHTVYYAYVLIGNIKSFKVSRVYKSTIMMGKYIVHVYCKFRFHRQIMESL